MKIFIYSLCMSSILYFCDRGKFIVINPNEGDTLSVYLSEPLFFESDEKIYSIPSQLNENKNYYQVMYGIGYWSEKDINFLVQRIDSIVYTGVVNWKIKDSIDLYQYLYLGINDSLELEKYYRDAVLTFRNSLN